MAQGTAYGSDEKISSISRDLRDLSDEELEERIELAAEKMVFSTDSEVAYGAAVLYGILTTEQLRRERGRLEREGKKAYRCIFTFKFKDEGGPAGL